MRIAAGIEYDGSAFCGWQIQAGTRTVQGAVEEALSRVADAPVRVITAGRTDTGVHARCQVVHFDTDRDRPARAWVRGATSNLPADVSVLWAQPAADDFHARYCAIERRYCYLIVNRTARPALLRGRATWEYRPLQADRMAAAARDLEGTHDFSAFRAAGCQAKSPVRELRALTVRRHGPMIVIEARANAFLHHMVRNLAGVLIAIGAGERPVGWAREVLEGRDRSVGGVTAPPDGLYLAGITYPERFGIPACRGGCWPGGGSGGVED